MTPNSSPPNRRLAVSGSETDLWDRCRRRWLTEYYWGFLPADPSPLGALNFGNRVHLALEGHFGYGADPLWILDVIYAAEMERHADLADKLAADLEKSKIMVEGLLEWMKAEGHYTSFQVVETEKEVRVPLPGFDGVDLRAKLDQVGRDTGSGLFSFLDWKTGAEFTVAEMVRQSPQMRRYSLIQWLATGHPPPRPGQGLPVPYSEGGPPLVLGGIVATLKKVKRSPQSKPPYYQWDPFFHTAEIMATTLLGVQQTVSEILNARRVLDEARDSREQVDFIQRSLLKPTWITHDCRWSCPLAKGACGLMDDGSAWVEHFVSSGAYVQGDPYERYTRGSVAALVGA